MNTISNKMSSGVNANELDVAAAFHEVWAHKWFVLIITVLVACLGLFYALKQPAQYQSNVLLQIDSKQPGFGQVGGVMQQLFLNGASASDSAPTQIALIQSRFILEPVIDMLGLNLTISPKASTFWQRFSLRPSSGKLTLSSFHVPRALFNKQLTLTLDRADHIVLHSGKKLLLEGRVGQLISNEKTGVNIKIDRVKAPIGAQFTLTKKSDAKVMQQLLSRMRIDEAGGDMRQNTGVLDISLRGEKPALIVKTLNAIATTTQKKDAEKKAQEAAQTLDFLYQQLPLTKNLLESAEKALNQYRAKSGKIDIKVQSKFLLDQLAGLAKQQGELQIKKIEMLQQYTNKHPMLIALSTQIQALQAQQNVLHRELRKLPASDQVALNLMRDVKVKQALYTVLLKKIQELQVVKAGTVSSVRILSYAEMPDASLPGKKVFIMAGSVVLGVLLSCAFIFGRKLIHPRVDDPHWTEQHYNLPNLAIVPYTKEQTEGLFESTKIAKQVLLAHSNPRNLAIESLRSLRTSLQVSLSCSTNNIISILGVSPGVGKSFVSANLAYLLAAGGKRVLLIDGDLRRGTLHKYFSVPPSPGLSEVLGQNVPWEQAASTVIHENLTILPRGNYPEDPSELLMSNAFKDLIHSLAQKFDVVVFDTAPVLLVTDAVVVSGFSASNYLVLGAGVHRPSEVELVLKRLSSAGVHVNGTIFNFHRLSAKIGYYGKYYHGKYNHYSYYYDETLKA